MTDKYRTEHRYPKPEAPVGLSDWDYFRLGLEPCWKDIKEYSVIIWSYLSAAYVVFMAICLFLYWAKKDAVGDHAIAAIENPSNLQVFTMICGIAVYLHLLVKVVIEMGKEREKRANG
jgi:hypothetical protein